MSGATVSVVGAGDCTLTASHPGNGNWNNGSRSVTFTVAKKNQTISFSQSGKTFGDADFTASASTDATGAGSLGYSSSTTGVCTVSGATVSVVDVGDCTLTASHPGNGNWNNASRSVTFTVGKGQPALSFSQSSKLVTDPNFTVAATTPVQGGSFTYTSSTSSVCTVSSSGVVTIVGPGTCTITAAYSGTAQWNSDTVITSFAVTTLATTTTLAPTTSTTVAPTTTTTPVSTTGSVAGVLWVDVNKNGKTDKNEPPVVGVPVQLVEAPVSAASVASQGIHSFALTGITNADGKFVITQVPNGSFRLAATIPAAAGLVFGADFDASSTFSVQGTRETFLNVGLVGRGSTTGVTVSTAESQPIAGAKVFCTWAGIDAKLGTSDDVEIPTISDAKGKFSLTGIPGGGYACSWRNSVTGAVVDKATLSVDAKSPSRNTVKVVRLQAHSSQQLGPTTLAATGNSARTEIRLALMLMVAGYLLLRRRRSAHVTQHQSNR